MQLSDITAIILAGGMGRRFQGQDKGLIEYQGQPLVERLIGKLQQQGVAVAINANRNIETYEQYGLPVFSDELDNYQGPLAGFATAMSRVATDYILTLPCDGPLLADDYVERYVSAANQTPASILVADDGERLQPVHAMIQCDLLNDLTDFLDSGERKIDRWYGRYDFTRVDFSDAPECFRNINNLQDLEQLSNA